MLCCQNPAGGVNDSPSYSITSLLGVRHAPMPHLLARRVIESISKSSEEHMAKKPLILSLGMKKAVTPAGGKSASSTDPMMQTLTESELEAVRAIVAEVERIKQW